ncbi:hypothetical protein O1D97_11940 [Marinomonas sp. 15G1-11]|uniref:Cytochrome c domain-containing protein n=1 Tax=Marinomonas phaeophyticola TaxID=3004091 RepID=A0ABT4JV98_9GAMM|nr:di-heme oxidoredictase family protein [Marinomonas sp. 15G1-11]MCZ2722320.1 hypothetical protein [Marinomonas sp. 15G1-11]
MTSHFCFNTQLKAGICASLLFIPVLTAASPSSSSPISDASNQDADFSSVLGEAIFEKLWASSPSSTLASDGLGPLFNARSCHTCHLNEGGGKRPNAGESTRNTSTFFIRLGLTQAPDELKSEHSVWPDPIYGHQLQTRSVQGLIAEPSFAIMYASKNVRFDDGTIIELSVPSYKLEMNEELNKGISSIHQHTGLSARLSPHLTGMGLIDALSDEAILANADPDDQDKDGISGRANVVWDRKTASWKIGRFGYKATQPTLDQQNQSAFNGDIGLSTPLFQTASGDCTQQQITCLNAPNGNSPHLDNLEINQKQVNWVNIYLGTLPVVRIQNTATAAFEQGKQQFIALNCIACHVPKYTTATSTLSSTLENRVILPFSDFLLHDMGDALASGFTEYSASAREWRTAPLWGMSKRLAKNPQGGFLHDGRAKTINEAILWHGGEASASQAAYLSSSLKDRNALLYFLESL